jgi:hypothetical protein
MPTTTTSPRVLARQEKAERRERLRRERNARIAGRQAAEGQPRPSMRGRPRRDESSAALYCLTVRLTPTERRAVQAGALSKHVSIAEYARLQLTGAPRDIPCRMVEVPNRIDAEYARAVVNLSVYARQVAKAWEALVLSPANGVRTAISHEDRNQLRLLTQRLADVIDQIAPEKRGRLGRLMAGARVILNQAPRLTP